MGFSRPEYWSGLPFPSPGDLPTQGSNPGLPHCRQMLYPLSHQGNLIGNTPVQYKKLIKFLSDPLLSFSMASTLIQTIISGEWPDWSSHINFCPLPNLYSASNTTERLHFDFSLSYIGEGNGNPLQCSCLKNPRDGGAGWAAVYGVAQSRARLKQLSSSSLISDPVTISLKSFRWLLTVRLLPGQAQIP